MRWVGAWLGGDLRATLAALDGVPEDGSVAIFPVPVARAMSLRLLGEGAAAAAAVATQIKNQEQELATLDPSELEPYAQLALAYWAAGRDDDARRMLARIPEPLPEGTHPFGRAIIEQYAMLAYAALGDVDRGVTMLRRYQEGPYGNCEAFLRRHPLLASLRTHPEFEAIARAAAWPTREP